MSSLIHRTLRAACSLVALAVVGVVLPAGLIRVARYRFGGPTPWYGLDPPTDWTPSALQAAVSDRVTDAVLADLVIRLALVVTWACLAVFAVTLVAEVIHMARHSGAHLPDISGIGLTQRAARAVATGLLILIPLVGSPGRAVASQSLVELAPPSHGSAPHEAVLATSITNAATIAHWQATGLDDVAIGAAPTQQVAAPVVGVPYNVRPGDSVYAIAERHAGPDPTSIADYADRLLELNLGRQMNDGQWFTNAAYIDVGWELDLPVSTDATEGSASVDVASLVGRHVVEPGESLWSIADDELGDPTRWPELYDLNRDQVFSDGHAIDDPSIIRPGWALALPNDVAGAPVAVEISVDETTPAIDEPVPAVDQSVELVDHQRAEVDVVDTVDVRDSFDRIEHNDDVTELAGVQPVNSWLPHASIVPESVDPSQGSTSTSDDSSDDLPEGSSAVAASDAPALLTFERAAMLAAGAVMLLATRRRRLLRRARPRTVVVAPTPAQAHVERALRSIGVGDRLARVDLASRAAALELIDHGCRPSMLFCSPDGELELVSTGSLRLGAPWETSSGEASDRHRLPAAVPLEMLAPFARQVSGPCPTLVQLGVDERGRDVFVDLESLGAIEVGGPASARDAIVAAVAATLASSALAEVTPIYTVGVPESAMLGHRLHRSFPDHESAFAAAETAVGWARSMTSDATTFELRARAVAGETWEPVVVLIGTHHPEAPPHEVRLPADIRAKAVVSAVPLTGPSSTLMPDGEAWILRPAGLRLRPLGLGADDLGALVDLVTNPQPIQAADADGHATIYGMAGDDPVNVGEAASNRHVEPLDWALMVRLLGPVSVVDRELRTADFERSKARELVAWLATHRRRSTRSNARTALWEQDVRDATFANVVSDARRTMARLVTPGDGADWIERTLTDSLPLHVSVVTDAEVIERALAAARDRPSDEAIAVLEPAVELIVGLPFEGTSYLWPDAEGLTSNLVLLATAAAAELAAHHLASGNAAGVFAATGRGLRVLAGHEALIGLRMQAHARAGDLAGVRHEWDSYERVIDADPWSDGEPSPKLAELRHALLHPSGSATSASSPQLSH